VFDGAFMPTASFVAGGATPVQPPVQIGNVGDFDKDLVVGFGDFLIFVSAFGTAEGQSQYNSALDLSGDGQIGFADFLSFVKVFGKRYAAGKIAPIAIPEDGDAQSSLNGTLPKVGEVFDVTVRLAGAADLEGYGFELWYDQTVVVFEGAVGTGDLSGVLREADGTVSFGGSIGTGSEDLARVSFRLLRDPGFEPGPLAGLTDLVISDLNGGMRRVMDRGEWVVLPSETALKQNYPNPFNPETIIPYTVANEGLVSLRVYNTLGQQVATLVNDAHSAGYYRVVWDGRDAFGRTVASGIYMVRMVTADYVRVNKILLLK
jgi:hypothetical protein